jgi:hypothetical protein
MLSLYPEATSLQQVYLHLDSDDAVFEFLSLVEELKGSDTIVFGTRFALY